jgi:hypothetical protein
MSQFSLLSTLLKITTLVISLSFICSCKKPKIAEPQTVFSFKANGVSYKWSNSVSSSWEPQGALLSKLSTATGNVYYVLEGLDHSSDTFLNLALFTNTLQTTTYTTITTDPNTIFYSLYKINNVYCAPSAIGDSVNVTITDITNNFATGNFSAVMHDPTNRGKIEITEGSFQHVMIFQ